ncbi:hypothetical protein Psch_00681 [Pelotomaculum schinkii]|uniref:Uncharacterized protein n=1 Tax=Pelotomaculum schinkii TaxID=78350 RepID=A0A4Y7RDP0_9FIRM|nr:hypothetical protein Psch_00681 [Pelotomaculum schinkii]
MPAQGDMKTAARETDDIERLREIDTCFLRLVMLILSGDGIESAVLFKTSASLLKIERHSRSKALLPNVKHPVVPANTGVISRFTANCHFLNLGGKIIRIYSISSNLFLIVF